MSVSFTLLDHQCLRHVPERVRSVIIEVAEKHNVPPREIMGRTRERSVVLARHEAIYRVKALNPTFSSTQIGRWFNRDYTTILYAIAKYQDQNGAPRLCRYRWRAAA
jgi:chromosomal replication initiator protein